MKYTSHILLLGILFNILLSIEHNLISLEYSLRPYFKTMPSISDPFEDKDLFYHSIDSNMLEDSSDVYYSYYPSISYSFRENKKTKSTKKLKEFKKTNSSGVNDGTFIIEEMHHGRHLTIPVVVDLVWYKSQAINYNVIKKSNEKFTKKFTSRNNRQSTHEASINLLNQNIAGTNVALNLRGDITINGEVIFEDKDLIALNSNENKTWDIDIEQTQRFDIEGKIGDKLTLLAKQDSEADFSWENDLTIKWEGTKNDILQSAEAGNINLSLPSTQFVSVGSGKSEGLFGIKTVHQFGPLEIQSIISREQVKKSSKTFSGGQSSEWSYINDYNFIRDKYFFIDYMWKENYYPLHVTNSGALTHIFEVDTVIYDYDVYKKTTSTIDDGVNDVVEGIAYTNPFDESSDHLEGFWKRLQEGTDYEIDRLLGVIRLNNVSSQDAVSICYNLSRYNSETASFYGYSSEPFEDLNGNDIWDEDEPFEDLNGNDIWDGSYLSTNTDLELIYDECLDEDYDGTSEECENYLEQNEEDGFQSQIPKTIRMKLIKSNSQSTPSSSTWPLMLKNVYSLSGSNIDLNSLELEIVYNNSGLEETHSTVSKFQSFLTIFGLDTRSTNGLEIKDPTETFYIGDGQLDQYSVFINPIHGELFFPSHLPFALDTNPREEYTYSNSEFNYWCNTDDDWYPESCYNIYWGMNSKDLANYLDTELNDIDNNFNISSGDSGPAMYYSSIQGDWQGEHEFKIKFKHSSGSSTINLGFMIVEGSETVTLNGNVLTRGIDYTIDYFSGTLNLINNEANQPGADIQITYEENELISFDQKLLAGTHLKYNFGNSNFISGGAFFYDQSILDDNVEIGYEPMRNFIWNINGKFDREVDILTSWTNKIPLISTTYPSNISFEGEYAEVYPDPNPLGQGFLDDFEASKRSISMNLSARHWKISSPPEVSSGLYKELSSRGSMVWYNPWNEVRTDNIWPEVETSSQAGNTYTTTLWLRPFFQHKYYEKDELWNGITTSLYTSDYDLSRKKYLEIWLNTESFTTDDDITLHIDIGHLSEDINGDDVLNTEDIDVYGNGWGDNNLTDEEDIGIDLCPDIYENGSGGCNCDFREGECNESYENSDSILDPNGDNWCYNNDECFEQMGVPDTLRNTNYYKLYNGTEGNRDLGRYPDSEDLDNDYSLDTFNNYYSISIDPLDTLFGFVSEDPETHWKLFRVLLNDFEAKGEQSVLWTDVRHVRLWVDGMNQSYDYDNSIDENVNPKVIKIAKLEIVGNEWIELGSTSSEQIASIEDDEFDDEPNFTVSVLNTHDNSDEYFSPNEDVEGEEDELTGIKQKEQSLVLSFEERIDSLDTGGIDSQQIVAVKKSFSLLPNDKKNSFFAYNYLNMYVYGKPSAIDWNEDDSSVELLFRFGKDDQYYEIRQPIYNNWDNRNHINIAINELTKYKLEISLEEYEDIGSDGCINEVEDGYGSCVESICYNSLTQEYYNAELYTDCNDSEVFLDTFEEYCDLDIPDLVNIDRCEEYFLLSNTLADLFDPNMDDYISEPTDDFHPDSEGRTEGNYQYDEGEPFDDLNENNLFDEPPTEYIIKDEVWRWALEPLIDENGNGIWDEGENYTDNNSNGVWDNPVGKVCNHCTELRIKGSPAINNIEFVLIGVINNTENTVFGSVWLDEMRMTGVKKEKGQAFRLKGSVNFSDLLSLSANFEQRDADFHLLQERLGTGNNSQSFTLTGNFKPDKFLPNKWGVKIPINFFLQSDLSSPKFYPGTDILSGGIDDSSEDVQTINEKISLSTSFNKSGKSSYWLSKYTIDQIGINFSFVDRYKSTPTIESEIARDMSISGNYGYDFSDSNFLLPFKSIASVPIIGELMSDTRIYWTPQDFSTSINLSEHDQISTQRSGNSTPTYSLNMTRKYSVNYRLTQNVILTYANEKNSNFDDIEEHEEVPILDSHLLEVIESFSEGIDNIEDHLIKKKKEGLTLNYSPDYMKWLDPNFKYTSAYSWELSNNQSDDPSLNSANIGTIGNLNMSFKLNPTDFIEQYYKPEGSNSSKKRRKSSRSSNKDENVEENKEITNPLIKSVLKSIHSITEPVSKINISYNYKVSNGHSNIWADSQFDPNYLYRFGFSDNPHDGNTFFNDSNGVVNGFYHQYINDFKISTNISLTKKISANIDYKNNNKLTIESSSPSTKNISNTYFPLGIRGDDGFRIFNWSITWSGIEKIGIFDKLFRTITLQHSFSGDSTASYKNDEVQNWGYSRNFSPLIGLTAKTNHKNSINFRATFSHNLSISNSGNSTEQVNSMQLTGRIEYEKSGGITIPLFFFRDFSIQNNVNFGFDVSWDRDEKLMTSTIISDPSDFNQQDLSTTLSLKPRIGYSFTKYISGDIYLNYILTENKTTGRRQERDFGFNVRIRIQG